MPILFPTGEITATPGALAALAAARTEPGALLARHITGDWGELDTEDQALNRRALRGGDRLLSSYTLPTKETIWIITEADRSVTTFLLPKEY